MLSTFDIFSVCLILSINFLVLDPLIILGYSNAYVYALQPNNCVAPELFPYAHAASYAQ